MKPENGDSGLSSSEEEAVKAFQVRYPSVCRSTCIKFLMARKFNVDRASSLFDTHELTRTREGLTNFQPTHEPLRSELETGKFTVLPWRDSQGAAITMFTASRHWPGESSHRTTLQGVVYQLDVAIENTRTQRDGIVFIYNMLGSKYDNFDYELCQKILNLLKGAYPARLKKVLIVSAPLWFRAPFKILRLFVREKLRDRVMIVSLSQLASHIPATSLPKELGGTQPTHDHHAWLLHCLKIFNQHGAGHDLISLNSVSLNGSMDSRLCQMSATLDIESEERERDGDRDRDENNCSSRDLHGESDEHNMLREDGRQSNGKQALMQTAERISNGNGNPNNQVSPVTDGDEGVIIAQEEEGDDSSLVSATSIHNQQQAQQQQQQNGSLVVITGSTLPEPTGPPPAIPTSGVPHLATNIPAEITPPPIQAHTPPALEPPRDMTMEEFILDLQKKGRKGLYREYAEIKSRPPVGTFDAARDKINQSKNRYTDVLCLDHSRVKISVSELADEDATDYINANYVDGYHNKKAFISTQGPLPRTFGDFWKMIWDEKCGVIVMTTKTIERARTKCGQYWPLDEGEEQEHGEFRISNLGVEMAGDYQMSELQINLRESENEDDARTIWHLQFITWPDYGVPESAFAMLSFRDACMTKQAEITRQLEERSLWTGPKNGPPIVVHCSAGIGRTGTFITLDTCIRRLENESLINVRGTVESIRCQRAFSIQMPDQYVFCHLALLEYALVHGHLKNVDLSGFDDSSEESADDA